MPSKSHLILLAIGVAVGYLASSTLTGGLDATLSQYTTSTNLNPFDFAFRQGTSLGTKAA